MHQLLVRLREGEERMSASHHKPWLAKTGITKTGVSLNTDAMDAGVGYALIDIQVTMQTFPSCQKKHKKTKNTHTLKLNLFIKHQSKKKKAMGNYNQSSHLYMSYRIGTVFVLWFLKEEKKV